MADLINSVRDNPDNPRDPLAGVDRFSLGQRTQPALSSLGMAEAATDERIPAMTRQIMREFQKMGQTKEPTIDDVRKLIMEKSTAASGQIGTDAVHKDVVEKFTGKGPTATALQKKLFLLQDTKTRAIEIGKNLDLDAFTVGGKFNTFRLGAQEKLLGKDTLNLNDQQLLESRRRQSKLIETLFQIRRKVITGAQASVQELENLKKGVINTDLSPSEARSETRGLLVDTFRDIAITEDMLREGIVPKTKEYDRELVSRRIEFGEDRQHQIELQILEEFPNLMSAGQRAQILKRLNEGK